MDDLTPEARDIGAALVPYFRNGRRPAFWEDGDVRAYLAGAHRQMTLERCIDACREKFGAARTPSRSALQRFWAVLDKARAKSRRRLP